MLNVRKICSPDIDLADPEESVHQAAQRMLARRVGTLVIIDERRRPLGIVTDRDLVVRVLAPGKDPSKTLVRDVLTAPVNGIREDASIDQAVSLMQAERCRRLVVLDANDCAVGVVSLDDVLALLAEQMRGVAALIESEAPHALEGEVRLGC